MDSPQPRILARYPYHTTFWNAESTHQWPPEMLDRLVHNLWLIDLYPLLIHIISYILGAESATHNPPGVNAVANTYVETTALAATMRGGAALVALSTNAGTTAGDKLLSNCINTHGSRPDDSPSSLFMCFYEHLLDSGFLDLSTSDAERDRLGSARGILLVLTQPDMFGLFLLFVILVCVRSCYTYGECFV